MFEFIEFVVCYGEGFKPVEIRRKTRKAEVLFARQLIMYLARKYKVGTWAEIGYLVGKKDHATVLHANRVIKNYITTDKDKRAKIEYYDLMVQKVSALSEQKKNLDKMVEPLAKQVSELEQRCINLTLQIAFVKGNL